MSGISQVTLHPWCRDIPRDEAVRASEDGRSGPLPTLEECIERQTARPCGGADPAPLGGEPGGAANGLRTERVTLEVTHHCRFPLKEWLLEMVEEVTSDPGESVRVVDESAPAANGAARTEPDAWGVRRNGLVDCVTHRLFRSMAERSVEQFGGTVIPLYAAPQAASGWLTAEEREALTWWCGSVQPVDIGQLNDWCAAIRNLLARSSPPKVELPECPYDGYTMLTAEYVWCNCVAVFTAALAAAGVTVKEVGRE